MTPSRHFFPSSPWIATGTPDYVNLGYTSRGLAKQALMRLSPKSLAIFRKLGLALRGLHLRRVWRAVHFHWEWMNQNQTMMHPDGGFIKIIGLVVDPVFCIAQNSTQGKPRHINPPQVH